MRTKSVLILTCIQVYVRFVKVGDNLMERSGAGHIEDTTRLKKDEISYRSEMGECSTLCLLQSAGWLYLIEGRKGLLETFDRSFKPDVGWCK